MLAAGVTYRGTQGPGFGKRIVMVSEMMLNITPKKRYPRSRRYWPCAMASMHGTFLD
jgi:hypothetical protein